MQKQSSKWQEALELLQKGNQRFTSGLRSAEALVGHTKLKELSERGQKPFAIILSCSDSRVPAELLFDCGFGELFVVRVAGNVVQPSQIASIEYAAKVLGSTLCVVMGHSKCGAVQAALDFETGKKADLGPNIALLIDLIRPAVQRCVQRKESQTQSMLDCCIAENVSNTAADIMAKSTMLRTMANEGQFKVVEAVFHLDSGKVNFSS